MTMIYPTKPHTRLNSATFFQHVFTLFPKDVSDPIVTTLDEVGVDTLIDLLAEQPVTFETYTYTKTGTEQKLTKK